MWRRLLNLARYLGLKTLALAVNRKLVALLNDQYSDLETMVEAPVEPPAKKRRLSISSVSVTPDGKSRTRRFASPQSVKVSMDTTHASSPVRSVIPSGIDFAVVIRPPAIVLEPSTQGTSTRIDGSISYVPIGTLPRFGSTDNKVSFELHILPSTDSMPVAVYTTLKDFVSSDVMNLAIAVTWSVSEHTVVMRTSMVPEPLGFLRFLGDEHVSDCAFLAKGSDAPIYASRLMLARATSSTTAPIPFDSWHAASVVLMLIHIYSGWLPGQPLPLNTPAHLVADPAYDPAKVEYPTWRNFLELA
ncbi:hypothetical protein GGF32_004029 [Allomyces javanicus]|nr:hypothetical protein GGF32_004029 [Allomyces javanicus]